MYTGPIKLQSSQVTRKILPRARVRPNLDHVRNRLNIVDAVVDTNTQVRCQVMITVMAFGGREANYGN